jgi:hypothetical protein
MLLLFFMPFFVVYAVELGSPYNYKYNHKLQINKTTVQDAIEQYGKPNERYHVKSQVASYVFLRYYSTDLSLFSGKARMSYLEFRENLLYAYITVSNFDNDSTNFSYTKAKEIKVGDTIDEVVYRIGEPSGMGKCPMNTGRFSGFCKEGEYTWMWLYAKTNGMMNSDKLQAKAFLVGVDKEGKVIEVERDRITILTKGR